MIATPIFLMGRQGTMMAPAPQAPSRYRKGMTFCSTVVVVVVVL